MAEIENENENENERSQSSVGAYIEGKVDTGGGDFVGRDRVVFAGRDVIASRIITGDVHIAEIGDPVGEQIKRLRGRITRLVPAEETLYRLDSLSLDERQKLDSSTEELLELLIELDNIEAKVSPTTDSEEAGLLLQSLSRLTDRVNVQISRQNSKFAGYAYSAASSVELFQNMVSKIGHKELREESRMHLDAVTALTGKLNLERVTLPGFDVLSDEAYGTMRVLIEIEKRKHQVRSLIQSDRKKRNWTVVMVTTYIALSMALIVLLALRAGGGPSVGQVPLGELQLPLIGVPWPVIMWSLIGSFAAMIHRFNKRPIHDFGDAVKWLITRPVQGVVLGAAFYFVVVSGLFLFTGATSSGAAIRSPADEVILVLSFLVGFSDRFADRVFEALLQRFPEKQSADDLSSEG